MVSTPSTMTALGSTAAKFDLHNVVNNARVSVSQMSGQPLLVMFICNHCPYVVHIVEKLTDVANQAFSDGVAVVAINSNDVENYPQDSPENMVKFAKQYEFSFPYCFDADQSVARAYGAACTPDFFLYDENHSLVYRGQFDESRPKNNQPVTGADLSGAIYALLNKQTISEPQIPSLGCNIKWKPGNEPDYF